MDVRMEGRRALVTGGSQGLGFAMAKRFAESGADVALLVGLAAPLVFLCGLNQPILATALVLKSSLRGAGATRLVMRYSFSTMILFRGILVPVAVLYFGVGLYGIWVIMFIDVAAQAAIFSGVHFRGKWVETKV